MVVLCPVREELQGCLGSVRTYRLACAILQMLQIWIGATFDLGETHSCLLSWSWEGEE